MRKIDKFGFWTQTKEQTNRKTMVVVKSLSQLKKDNFTLLGQNLLTFIYSEG